MIKVNDLPFVEENENLPKSDKYLGVSEKGEARTAQRHKCTRAQTLCGTGSHGKGGMVTLERQDRIREGPPRAHSSQVCFVEKGGTTFGVPLISVRHAEGRHKSCLCKAQALKNQSKDLPPKGTTTLSLANQKICALLVSISRLARPGGSEDAA